MDVLLGSGILMLTRNRAPDTRGRAFGGVALLYYKEDMYSFKQLKLDIPGEYEVLIAIGTIQGITCKVAVIGCYVPPNYTAERAKACLNYIEEMVIEMKRRVKDPYIVVMGNFNQWSVQEAVQEFRDVNEVHVGPLRGSIDRCFTSMDNMIEANTLSPLQTEGEDDQLQESDHKITFVSARLLRGEKYKWLSYSYRYNNEESTCLLYTSPSPRDRQKSRMPSSA